MFSPHAIDVHVLREALAVGRINVPAEQALLAAHDRIILQSPFHAPGILHDWFDAVLERGWAYGPGGHALEGKELGIAVSTWSTAEDYSKAGRYHRTLDDLTSAFEVTASRVGMTYIGGRFPNGVGHVTDEELALDAKVYLSFATVDA